MRNICRFAVPWLLCLTAGVAHPAAPPIPVADDHTLLLLHFDGPSGGPRDVSTSARHVSLDGAVLTSDGKTGGALNCAQGGAIVADTPPIVASGAVTFECWIKVPADALTGLRPIMTRLPARTTKAQPQLFLALQNGRLVVGRSTTGNDIIATYGSRIEKVSPYLSGRTVLPPETWSHIAYVALGTYASGGREWLFVNGEQDATRPTCFTGLTMPGELRLGGLGAGGRIFGGVIDEVRLSDIARDYPGVAAERQLRERLTLLNDISYTYDPAPVSPGHDDPQRQNLLSAAGGMVIWSRVPAVTVDFDLKTTHRVDRVEVEWWRNNAGWCTTDMSLFLDAGQEYQLADRIETGLRGADLLAGRQRQQLVFARVGKNAHRLRIVARGGLVALRKIRIYGEPVEQKTVALAAAPSYRLPRRTEELVLEQANFDHDPETEVYIGNRFYGLVIEPQGGAVIAKMAYRDWQIDAEPNYGLLGDHVTSQGVEAGDWWNAPYKTQVLEKTPEQVRVRFSAQGKTGVLAYLTFNKTISARRDRADIIVDYDITLAEEAQSTLEFAFWFHHMAAPDGAWSPAQNVTYFFPTENGIRPLSWHADARGDHWYYRPARGWTGFIDARTHTGLLLKPDFKYVACYYLWGSGAYRGKPTLEWRFNPVPIRHGESFSTQIVITPFHSLGKISGAQGPFAGSLEPGADKVTAKICASAAATIEATLRCRVLPETDWTEIGTQKISLAADGVETIAFPFTSSREGTHVFSLVARQDGRDVLDLEDATVIGRKSSDYVFQPKEEPYRPQETKVNLSYTSLEVVTPHIPWGRPYAGGSTKAIVLLGGFYQREIVELAQRLELDLITTYLHPEYPMEFGDYIGVLTDTHMKTGLQDMLSKHPDWEVMVLPGIVFDRFDAEQQALIAAKVKEGRGLVLVQPDDIAPVPELSPLTGKGEMLRAPWHKEKAHFTTTGIPFEALPATDLCKYSTAAGDVLVTARGEPLLAIGTPGNGRVVALAYRTGPKGMRHTAALLPLMRSDTTEFAPQPTFDYHEYHFSLLAKAVLWAARQEPDVEIETIEARPAGLAVRLTNHGRPCAVRLLLSMKNKYGRPIASTETPRILAAGSEKLTLPLPAPPPNGLSLFDLFIRNEKGQSINWGSAALTTATALAIAEMETDKKIYAPDDTVQVTVTLAGAASPEARLALELVDGFGRVLARDEKSAEVSDLAFALPISTPVNYLLEVRAALKKNGSMLDTLLLYRTVRFPLEPSAHQGDPYFLNWGSPVYRGANLYLLPHYAQRLFEAGVNADMWRSVETLRANRIAGQRVNKSYLAGGWGIGGHPQTAGDAAHPCREPSLLDRELLARYEHAATAFAENSVRQPARLLGVLSGDENALGPDGVDLDFSEPAIAAFREWIATQYPSVEALNAEWQTEFRRFDQVVPLTLAECRARGGDNFAPWSDFRTFGEVGFTAYFGRLTHALTRTAPQIGHGMSGTPYPTSYNGYDYWRLSQALTCAMPYFGTEEFAAWTSRSFRIMRWNVYHPETALARRSLFSALFGGATGVGFCGDRIWFNPDMTYSRVGKAYAEAYRPIHAGLGRLLIESTLTHQPIGMHYSQRSVHVSRIFGEQMFWRTCRESFRQVAADSGLHPVPAAYEEIEKGKLKDLKVLFLPLSYALSDQEVAAIEAFVHDGGLLIAELGAGIADGHGRFREAGALDRLFGIRRSGIHTLTKRPETLSGTRAGLDGVPINHHEPGLAAAGAEVLAALEAHSQPLVFMNRSGKGTAVYIGCDLTASRAGLNRARVVGDNAKRAAQVEDFFIQLFATVGCEPWLTLSSPEGGRLPFTTVVRFSQGAITYYGLLRSDLLGTRPVEATVRFPEKGFVYDILQDNVHGWTDAATSVFTPLMAKVYSWLPYEVQRVELRLDVPEVQRGSTFDYTIRVHAPETPSRHTMRLEVQQPDGARSVAYSRNLSVDRGRAPGKILIALNEMPGTWTLKLRDLTSGKRAEARLLVKE